MTLLIIIIVCVVIFWTVSPELIDSEDTYEEFTGYVRWSKTGGTGSNLTGVTITLEDTPSSVSNVTCWNESGHQAGGNHQSYPATTTNGNLLYIAPNLAKNFTQVNITYISEKTASGDEANDMFVTIVPLMIIIALILVAGIIIAIISKFGGG